MKTTWPHYDTTVVRDGKEIPILVVCDDSDGYGKTYISHAYGPNPYPNDLIELTKEEEITILEEVLVEYGR